MLGEMLIPKHLNIHGRASRKKGTPLFFDELQALSRIESLNENGCGTTESRRQEPLGISKIVTERSSNTQTILLGEPSNTFDETQIKSDVLLMGCHDALGFPRCA